MERKHISTGSSFEAAAGYARAIVAGDWCFVSGTTGYDYQTMTMPDDIGDQCRNALATIDKTLADAGFERAHVVRARYVITDPRDGDAIFPVLASYFADIRPAATMTVSALIKPEMKIEIDVTAYKG